MSPYFLIVTHSHVQLGNASAAILLQGYNGVKRTGIMCP